MISGEKKFIIGVITASLLILVAAVFFLTRNDQNVKRTFADTKLLVRDDSYKISSPSATVTLVEFADFQCPACGAYSQLLKRLEGDFAGKVNFVYRHFPLPMHDKAQIAAEAAEAAGEQGKFWPMHDLLFSKQSNWSKSTNVLDTFTGYAQQLGLDTGKFKTTVGKSAYAEKIQRDVTDGNALGVDATPTFFLDGEKLDNPRSYEDFKALIDAAIVKVKITISPADEVHEHADFAVYLDGQLVDFSPAKYQSTEEKELHPSLHLHSGRGNLIHKHKKGATLGAFFTSLGMQFSKDCFVLDTAKKYCSQGDKTLKFYVNGKPNAEFDQYSFQDLDRLLISYGKDVEAALKKQLAAVSDIACIYSEKCPQRGKPEKEECVGGLGTGCH